MNDCPTCPKGRRERQYRSVPRHARYSEAQYSSKPARYSETKYNSRPRKYSWDLPDCDSCFTTKDDICVSPCPPPCPIERCYCCPEETESGFLHTIRNGFQRIFNGRKRVCSPGCEPMKKGKISNYSPGQLRYIEQHLEKLEEEACCIENIIKEAYNYDCSINCNSIRDSLSIISERADGIRCDLMCAYDCYDPCRDRCEYDLICSMLDRVNQLESFVNDLCLQLGCLAYESNCYPPACDYQMTRCKPDCEKPCCLRPVACQVPYQCRKACCVDRGKCRRTCCVKPVLCEPGCRKPCCVKPIRCRGGNGKRRLCRTASVIPVGVMLVKL